MNKIDHVAFGLHSGIPLCCVMFFVDEWDKNLLYLQKDNQHTKNVAKSKAGYVQCPSCLRLGYKVKVKQCIVECGGSHIEDFIHVV